MVQLARQLRLQNITNGDTLGNVIREKVKNIKILGKDGMCSMGQVRPENQREAFSKMVTNIKSNKTELYPSDEDMKSGYKLCQAIVFCPTMLIKLFRFVDQLLSSESSRTIIQTFEHLLQPGSMKDLESYTLTRQFYLVLTKTLRLQRENVLAAIFTKPQFQPAIESNSQFMPSADHSDEIQGIFQELGRYVLFLQSLIQ